MHITEYFQQIQSLISRCPAVLSFEIQFDQRTPSIGFIKGRLVFRNEAELHFREFVETEGQITRYSYVFHYQEGSKLVFRYDNAPHPGFKSSGDHKHDHSEETVVPSSAMDLENVLEEIIRLQ